MSERKSMPTKRPNQIPYEEKYFVKEEDGKLRFYRMIPNGEEFTTIAGTTGYKNVITKHPIYNWDRIYNARKRKGYTDQTDVFRATGIIAKRRGPYPSVVVELRDAAKKTFASTYLTPARRMTPEQIQEADDVIACMADIEDLVEFNSAIIYLCQVMPRRTDNMAALLAVSPRDYSTIIVREKSLLSLAKGEFDMDQKEQEYFQMNNEDMNISVMDMYGVSMSEVSPQEEQQIKGLLGKVLARRFQKAWRVVNQPLNDAYYEKLKQYEDCTERLCILSGRDYVWWSRVCLGVPMEDARDYPLAENDDHYIAICSQAAEKSAEAPVAIKMEYLIKV